MSWYFKVLKKYFVFSGRARRKEYWYFSLFSTIIYFAFVIVCELMKVRDMAIIYSLAILIPSWAVGVRRLHDTNRSGWWMLINFVLIIGNIVFFVFTLQDSTPGENRFGPNPKEVDNENS